jgi:hypothetical protein
MSIKLPQDFDWQAITPEDSPKTPMDVMADPRHQDLATATLSKGDPAYDFKSKIYDYSDGTEQDTGQVFHLAEVAKEKPVALIFGSYT